LDLGKQLPAGDGGKFFAMNFPQHYALVRALQLSEN
jgi:hypothetical protein